MTSVEFVLPVCCALTRTLATSAVNDACAPVVELDGVYVQTTPLWVLVFGPFGLVLSTSVQPVVTVESVKFMSI